MSAPNWDPSIATGSEALAAATAAAGSEMSESPSVSDIDMLNTPNLRLLASFLKEEGGDNAQPRQVNTLRLKFS